MYFVLHQLQIFAYYKMFFFSIVFSLTLLSDFKLLKRIIFIYIIFSFLSKSECSCLPDFVSWETPEPNSFSKIWDKVVTIFFFFTISRITYYFPIISGILFTWRQCEVAVLCHYFLNRTTIHFPLKDLWLKYYREK